MCTLATRTSQLPRATPDNAEAYESMASETQNGHLSEMPSTSRIPNPAGAVFWICNAPLATLPRLAQLQLFVVAVDVRRCALSGWGRGRARAPIIVHGIRNCDVRYYRIYGVCIPSQCFPTLFVKDFNGFFCFLSFLKNNRFEDSS
uniref:Uncharacterized protein n=1 Tax=Physcomitrium patens TaxID=3218 RepID=A0A7I3YXV7_PHYPA